MKLQSPEIIRRLSKTYHVSQKVVMEAFYNLLYGIPESELEQEINRIKEAK